MWRLLVQDMFSGWGVRTLSANHPAYDPYSYHRGSVWPVEHGSFAMGMMRFGLIKELHTIARALFETSTLFDDNRLPECFSGHPRDSEHPFPAFYPKTNWPQAWSASSLFAIMQAMLASILLHRPSYFCSIRSCPIGFLKSSFVTCI
ncbi:MAG: hypothetical protein WAL56_20625 [Candidatus Sulfotelmatobacter sp.]